jgi:hypothetical protein
MWAAIGECKSAARRLSSQRGLLPPTSTQPKVGPVLPLTAISACVDCCIRLHLQQICSKISPSGCNGRSPIRAAAPVPVAVSSHNILPLRPFSGTRPVIPALHPSPLNPHSPDEAATLSALAEGSGLKFSSLRGSNGAAMGDPTGERRIKEGKGD